MLTRIHRSIIFLGVISVFLLWGCSYLKDYATLELAVGPVYKISIQELIENWANYDIYYTGTAGEPFAVVFDPKNDDKVLAQERWSRVERQEDLTRLVAWIRQDAGFPQPYVLLDSNRQMYGYIFTARPDDVTAKKVDDKTMIVYRMLPRSEYEIPLD